MRAIGEPGTELRAIGDRVARGAALARPALLDGASDHGPRPDAVLLYAVLEPGRPSDGPGIGTAALIADERGGEPHPLGDDRLLTLFTSPEDAADAAIQLAADPRLRCRAGLHVGGTVQFGDRLLGAGPPRCRLIARAAHHGQILVSAAARDRFWPDAGLRDLGRQRYEDLLAAEPVYELGGAPDASFPLPDSLTRHPNNLPVMPTRLIGRRRELDRLTRMMGEGTLLTLIGVGGGGKTRLALQLAARRASSVADGAWFATLAELPADADVETVATTIVTQLGARIVPKESAATTLERHLAERRMVLMVDNCEHVIDACRTLLMTLRAGAPSTCLLATSRRPLRVPGEWAVDVPAMSLGPDDDAPDQLPDAVELLLERAGSLPDVGTGDTELVEAATRICTALEGLPLAIELAAGQIPARGLTGVAAAIEEMMNGERGLGFLSGEDPGHLCASARWRRRSPGATTSWTPTSERSCAGSRCSAAHSAWSRRGRSRATTACRRLARPT